MAPHLPSSASLLPRCSPDPDPSAGASCVIPRVLLPSPGLPSARAASSVARWRPASAGASRGGAQSAAAGWTGSLGASNCADESPQKRTVPLAPGLVARVGAWLRAGAERGTGWGDRWEERGGVAAERAFTGYVIGGAPGARLDTGGSTARRHRRALCLWRFFLRSSRTLFHVLLVSRSTGLRNISIWGYLRLHQW